MYGMGRSLSATRRRRGVGSVVKIVGATFLTVATVMLVLQPAPSLHVGGKHATAALASGSEPSYSPSELWGGGNPDESCDTCTTSELLGESTGQSLQGDQLISPVNGDFTQTNSLFSVNTVGGDLSTELTYDAALAQAEAASGATYSGYFGWGWSSTINYSATPNVFGQVTLNEPNGSAVTFSPALNDGCGTGDYEDFQKYTTSDSYLPWCATSRLDAQLGSFGGVGFKLTEGNGDESGYSWTGQLAWSGTRADPQALTYTYNIAPGGGGTGVPSSDTCLQDGESSCFDITDGTHCVSTEIDTFGFIQKVIDPSGQAWTIGYNDSTQDLTSVTAPSGSTTLYSYNTTAASPYNMQMNAFTNPGFSGQPTGVTDVYYLPAGMAYRLVDPSGGQTVYTYSNTTCTSSTGCVGIGVFQFTEVSYQDGVNDFDNYEGGVLISDAWGPGSTTQSGSNQEWQFTWTWAVNQVNYYYDTVTMPTGATAVILYDAVGNVVAFQDPNDNTTYSMYNDTGGNDLDELCWTTNPGVSVPYNASCSNPPPGSTSYTYDANGNQLSVTDPLGHTSYSGYYTNGLLCWTAEASVGNGSPCTTVNGVDQNPNGAPAGSTIYEYTLGNQTLKTVAYNTPYAQTTQDYYDADSELVAEVPPDGVNGGPPASNPYATQYVYPHYGVLSQVDAPLGRDTSYTYDGAGNVLTKTDASGVTTNTYDTSERLCWTITAFNAVTSPTCVAGTDGPTGSTSYGYLVDTPYVTTMVDPNGNATTYQYTDFQHISMPTITNDAMGTQKTFAVYDSYGNTCLTGPYSGTLPSCPATASATPSGDTGSITNAEGQLLSTTDPMGEITSYAYTNAAFPTDPTSMTNPLGKTTTYTYDADGDQIQATDPMSNTITTGFDQDGRECYSAPVATSASCSSPPTGVGVTTMAWNAADERSQMVDNYGSTSSVTSTFSYDADGNLTSQSDDNGRTVGYAYDDAGETSCIAYPVSTSPNCSNAPSATNSVVDRTYDGAGRLATVTDWLGNTTNYINYNQLSELGGVAFPTGETLNYEYDADGNLTSADYAGTTVGNNSWSYNADEEQASTSQLGTFASPTDAYNNYKQVTTASNPTGSGSVSDTYSVASNGEMLSDQAAGKPAISLSYNGGAQLTSLTNPNLPAASADSSYAYTADGQRCWSDASSTVVTSPTCGSAPSGSTSYQWNARGQLCWSGASTSTASCSAPPSGVTTYTYSGDGLRMTETPPTGSQLKFSWDTVDGGTIPLLLDDGTNAYIYGSTLFGGTAPVEQINQSTGAVSYLASIPAGVQDVFSSSGSVQEQAAYSTYGTWVIELGSVATPFGFQGSYTDPTGLIYLINRYYDPSADQFLSVDPDVATTGQPYAFTGDDPLNATDPLGLFPHKKKKQSTGKSKTGRHQRGEARQKADQARSNNPNKRQAPADQSTQGAQAPDPQGKNYMTVTPSANPAYDNGPGQSTNGYQDTSLPPSELEKGAGIAVVVGGVTWIVRGLIAGCEDVCPAAG